MSSWGVRVLGRVWDLGGALVTNDCRTDEVWKIGNDLALIYMYHSCLMIHSSCTVELQIICDGEKAMLRPLLPSAFSNLVGGWGRRVFRGRGIAW
jgi:hypothetical protein